MRGAAIAIGFADRRTETRSGGRRLGGITFREPDGQRGQYKQGFRGLNDSAAEWQKFYGVEFEINLPDPREVELTAIIQRARRQANVLERRSPEPSASAAKAGTQSRFHGRPSTLNRLITVSLNLSRNSPSRPGRADSQ